MPGQRRESRLSRLPESAGGDGGPGIPARLREAGISCVWLAGFFLWVLALATGFSKSGPRSAGAGWTRGAGGECATGAPGRFARIQGWDFSADTPLLTGRWALDALRWQDFLRNITCTLRRLRKTCTALREPSKIWFHAVFSSMMISGSPAARAKSVAVFVREHQEPVSAAHRLRFDPLGRSYWMICARGD